MNNLSVNIRAIVLVLMAFAAYNAGDGFVKEAQNYYSVAEAAVYPIISYFILTLIFSKKFGSLTQLFKTKKLKLHLIRAFFGTVCYVCVITAIKYISLAETYTLFLTSPFWIALLSIYFFKEQIGFHRWSAIILGFIGVLLVLRPGLEVVTWPSVLPLIAALFFAVFVIYTKKIGEDEPLINMVIFPIIADLSVLIPMIIISDHWTPPQIEHSLIFIIAGACFLMGTTFSSLGYSSGESSMLAPIQYSMILWGTLIGYFFFDQTPELWTIFGAFIIVSSGIYLIYREHKTQQ